MPRKKKPEELTDEEVIRRLFPKKVVEEVKREVEPRTLPPDPSPTDPPDLMGEQ